MDWLFFSLGVATVSIAAYFAYLWNIDRRRAWIFLAEELVTLLFFTSLAYFVLKPQILVGGSLEEFSIQLALNRTVSLRDQFYQLHSQIVQVMEASVVVDVIVSIALVVLTAGVAIPLLQAFNVGFQAVLGIMEGAATLAGTAYMLLSHLYWLLFVGQALAFLIPVLGGMLVVPRARKVALSGLAVVFVLAVLLPYAVNVSYENVVVPRLNVTIPDDYGAVRIRISDIYSLPVRVPVVIIADQNHTLYVMRAVDGSVKYLPPGNYTIKSIIVYWTILAVPPCCYNNTGGGGFCTYCPAPARISVAEGGEARLNVYLPFSVITGREGVVGETVGYVDSIDPGAQLLMPALAAGAAYRVEPSLTHVYYVWYRAAAARVLFSNASVFYGRVGNKTLCWHIHYSESAATPWWLGRAAPAQFFASMYRYYTSWYNRTRYALPPLYAGRLEPGRLEYHAVEGRMLRIWFTVGACKCSNSSPAAAVVVINGTRYGWNESNTRYLSHVGLWNKVVEAGEEVKGMLPAIRVALAMLYNIYAFVVLGGLAFGGLLGVAGYTLPGIIQGYFRQGLRRSFATLPGLYRRLRFVKGRLEERKRAVTLPRKRLAFELAKIDGTVGWSRRRKVWEKTKTVARHVLPEALDIAGERLAPGLVRIVLDTYDWWVEHRTGWHRETVRGHYYLQRFYRAVKWTPLQLEEPIYRRIAELIHGKPKFVERVGEDEVSKAWRGYEEAVLPIAKQGFKAFVEARLSRFLEEYKSRRLAEAQEPPLEAYMKGARLVGDEDIEHLEKKAGEALEAAAKASSLEQLFAAINTLYAEIPPKMAPVMLHYLPDHNSLFQDLKRQALEELSQKGNAMAALALAALRGDRRALDFLSLADWIASARPELVGLELNEDRREALLRLVLLSYGGDVSAFEALLGSLSRIEGEVRARLYRDVGESYMLFESLGLDVADLAGEVLRQSLSPELYPRWMQVWDRVVDLAVLELAVKGVVPPPVETMLGLLSGRLDFERSYVEALGFDANTLVSSVKKFLEEAETVLEEAKRMGVRDPDRLVATLYQRLAETYLQAARMAEDLHHIYIREIGLQYRLEPLYRAIRDILDRL